MKLQSLIIIILYQIVLGSNIFGQSNQKTPSHFLPIKLADGIFTCMHVFGGEATCNAGVIDMGSYTVVIDPFLSPAAAEELQKWILEVKLPQVKYVINTHYHNDHVRGNQVFNSDVRIIATHKTATLIRDEEPKAIAAESQFAPPLCQRFTKLTQEYSGDKTSREFQVYKMMQPYFCALARSKEEIITRMPDSLFEGKFVLEGNRRLEIRDMGMGHTPSDAVVYLPDDKILFGSDLITQEFHPYLPDGDPLNWVRILERLDSLESTFIVPGHGEPGNKDLIQTTKDYLNEIMQVANEVKMDENHKQRKGAVSLPDKYKDWWLDQFYEQNIAFLVKQY